MKTFYVTPEMRSNFRHLYADTFWYGVLAGSVINFIAIYITRLGASGYQISLITAGPAIVNLLISLPGGRYLENRPLIRTTFWAAVLHRAGYLALIFLPFLFAETWQIWSVLLLILLMSIPGTLLAISFNAMFADVVPPEARGEVVGKRNAITAVSLSATTLLSGQILDRLIFPLNYQVVFGLGAVGALMTTYHLGRLRQLTENDPQRVHKAIGDLARPGIMRFLDAFRLSIGLRFLTRSGGKPLIRMDLLRGRSGAFMLVYLTFYTFQFVPSPLFPLAFVRQLHLSDGEISLGSALYYGVMLVTSLRVSAASHRFSHHRLLSIGALLYGLYPLLLGLAHDATLFWVASVLGGAVWALASAGLVNRLMERVPDEDRPAYMALHNMALNLGILMGSLVGPLLVQWVALPEALIIGGCLRILSGILLFVWG